MKAGIHPDYHKVTFVRTNGEEFEGRTTWGKEGQRYVIDTDPLTHNAWTGGTSMRKTGQVEKFGKRFGSVDFSTISKKASA
jgi:large subunit ribosomal protein L31